MTFLDLKQHIEEGKTFAPGCFKVNPEGFSIRKSRAWLSSSMVALDFDKNEDMDEKLAICRNYGIKKSGEARPFPRGFRSNDQLRFKMLLLPHISPLPPRKACKRDCVP